MSGPADAGSAGRLECFSWAMYDFANCGYSTVVLTTIFNAYFVAIVAGGGGLASGTGTFLWTLAIGIGNAIVMATAPVIGAIADSRAAKKRYLTLSSAACVVTTALLALVGAGDVAIGMLLVAMSLVAFSTGENLIAAFLPELVSDILLQQPCLRPIGEVLSVMAARVLSDNYQFQKLRARDINVHPPHRFGRIGVP